MRNTCRLCDMPCINFKAKCTHEKNCRGHYLSRTDDNDYDYSQQPKIQTRNSTNNQLKPLLFPQGIDLSKAGKFDVEESKKFTL